MGATPVVLGLGPSGTPATDGASAVVADYRADGSIDSRHQAGALRSALREPHDDLEHAAFADAVQTELDEMLLGARTAASAPAPPTPDEVRELAGDRSTFERQPELTGATSSRSTLGLPEPGTPEGGRPPWPLMTLSALAVLLAMTGAGSSLYRRLRRASLSGG